MSCDNVITVQDLETDKKHSTFYREVITGKAGGTGADIDSATNAVTGQVQKTLPKILDDIDWSYVGKFVDGVTFTKRTDFAIDADGTQWVYAGSDPLPKTVPPATVPSEPTYQVVHVRDHNSLGNRNAAGAHDAIYNRSFSSIQDMIDFSGHEVGLAYNVGSRVYEVITVTSPMLFENFRNITLSNRQSSFLTNNGVIDAYSHRGGENVAPENTLAAFELAIGMAGIETDARITSDGQWIIIHDPTVDRTTDGTGNVIDKTLAEIQALDAGSWFDPYYAGCRVPTVDRALQMMSVNELKLILEVKDFQSVVSDADYQKLYDICNKYYPNNNFILACTDITTLKKFRELFPDCPLQLYTASPANTVIPTILDLAPICISVERTAMSESDVKLYHDNNIFVRVHTLFSSSDRTKFLKMGADSYITTPMIGVRL